MPVPFFMTQSLGLIYFTYIHVRILILPNFWKIYLFVKEWICLQKIPIRMLRTFGTIVRQFLLPMMGRSTAGHADVRYHDS